MLSKHTARLGRSLRLGRTGFRRFSENTAPPAQPPPPPKEGGMGLGLPLLLVGAGAAYYYQDEIKDQLGFAPGDSAADVAKRDLDIIKEQAQQAEKRAVEAIEKATLQVKPAAEPAPAKAAAPAAPIVPETGPVDWDKVRTAIVDLLEEENYDDGSYGPVLVRLAWHSAGTFDKNTNQGGSEGAGMRFKDESAWGANAGLDVARALLEPVKARFPGVSYSDLWSFAGTVAIEEMGGPTFKWRPGRKDVEEPVTSLPDGLLPDADGRDHPSKPSDHLRDIFYRMGFNDKEIVCLSGAHALGRCHTDRSGFWGPWTRAPTTFSSEYFRLLLEERWSKKKTHMGKEWTGPEQYEDPTGDLMMLPTDLSLVWDEKMRPYVEEYAKDEEKFFNDFAKAWIKLQELGVRRFHGTRRYWIFGPRE